MARIILNSLKDPRRVNARSARARVRRSREATTEEIVRYFEARRKRLQVVRTTRTPSGQILDWVPITSQRPDAKIAEPPPRARVDSDPTHALPAGVSRDPLPVTFELENPAVERGPIGTVPIVRKDFSSVHATTSLREYLAKRNKRAHRDGPAAPPEADPDPFGYFHATSSESIICFGAEAVLNVWDPGLENSADHSLMQLGLLNSDFPQIQTLEAGWEVSNDRYGDWDPHLFIYYTTNGYTNDDDNVGGYNQDVDGWVQIDADIYPTAVLAPVSVLGGEQRVIKIKYALIGSNWWFQVQGKWIGYYPASLFGGGGAGLADHADSIGFWGEVYSEDADPNMTRTKMGSGWFAESGWAKACFQSHLRVQTKKDGTTVQHNGLPSAENSTFYDIVPHMKSGTHWGSYFYAGGPGQAFLTQTGTPITQDDAARNFVGFAVGDYDGDGIPDVYGFKRGSRSLEVHVLNGADGFQSFLLQMETPITQADAANFFSYAVGDFDQDGVPDIYCFKRTATNSLEVHMLNGADGYQSFLLHTGTPITQADIVNFAGFAVADYDGDGIPDVYGFKRLATGTQSLEVHVLNGADGYQSFLLHTGTPITQPDAGEHFLSYSVGSFIIPGLLLPGLFGPPAIFCFKVSKTGTQSLEVHVLNGAGDYQSFLLQSGTAITEGDIVNFAGFAVGDYDGDGIPDVYGFKRTATGTKSLEVHVLNTAQMPE